MSHHEMHKIHRSGWLRAAVLGANDGIVSTASLIIGVAAAGAAVDNMLLIGVAALVAGAMSMAAGEYVSVCSQADIEKADLALEQASIEHDYDHETEELAQIYAARGVSAELASQVAKELMAHDALGAHARDELGIVDHASARPVQAALSSAVAFTLGAMLPLLMLLLIAAWQLEAQLIWILAIASLFFLASLGGAAAWVGGARVSVAILRVTFWGALAMLITAAVGQLFSVVV